MARTRLLAFVLYERYRSQDRPGFVPPIQDPKTVQIGGWSNDVIPAVKRWINAQGMPFVAYTPLPLVAPESKHEPARTVDDGLELRWDDGAHLHVILIELYTGVSASGDAYTPLITGPEGSQS